MRFGERVALRYRLFLAMSLEDAARVLGVSPNASPEEISRAYKRKALENHPDRGGDNAKMVEVNVAKDVLEQKRPSSPPPRGPSEYQGPKWEPPPKKVTRITFDEALQKAHVPGGVTWLFRTQTAYGGYGDTHNAGTVLYGQTASEHVFVSIYNHRAENVHTGEDTDVWEILTGRYPLQEDLARLAPEVLRKLHKDFDGVKGYNAKVVLHKPGTPLSESILYGGTPMAFKDAMVQLGLVGDDSKWKTDRKITVVMVLNQTRGEMGDSGHEITLVVNGKRYDLDKASVELIEKKSKVLPALFGTYFYFAGDKKDVTRSRVGKDVLEWLSKKLVGEPQELRDLLEKAAVPLKR